MTASITPIDYDTYTFADACYTKPNEIITFLNDKVVSTEGTAVGNVAVEGVFSANVVVAGEYSGANGTIVFADSVQFAQGAGFSGIELGNANTVGINGANTSHTNLRVNPSTNKMMITSLRDDIMAIDGANSGIDADLLDGQHGSYYLNYNNMSGQVGSNNIANGAVTLAKIQNIGAFTVIGRNAPTAGAPDTITVSNLRSMLNVANGATQNQPDSYLLDRANHTGTQPISSITGLQAALDSKVGGNNVALTGVPTAPTATTSTNNTQIATTAFVHNLFGTRNIATAGLASGGSSLSSNTITITVASANTWELATGTANNVAMTPWATRQAIDARVTPMIEDYVASELPDLVSNAVGESVMPLPSNNPSSTNRTYPVGTILVAIGEATRNASVNVYLTANNNISFTLNGPSSNILGGTWRARGVIEGFLGITPFTLVQRVL